jgi:hypothetical protein
MRNAQQSSYVHAMKIIAMKIQQISNYKFWCVYGGEISFAL